MARQPIWFAGLLLCGLLGVGVALAMAQDRVVSRGADAAAANGGSGAELPGGAILAPARAPRRLVPSNDTGDTGQPAIIGLHPSGEERVASPRSPQQPAVAGPRPASRPAPPALIPPRAVPIPVGAPPLPVTAPRQTIAPRQAALTPPPGAAPRVRAPASVPRPPDGRPKDLARPSAGTAPLPTAAGIVAPPPPPTKQLVNLPSSDGEIMRVEFSPGSAILSKEARMKLGALAAEMRAGDGRLRLEAFAGRDHAGTARRISLSRALTVRSYLIEQGMSGTRVDVRAAGVAHDGGSEDRVDVILQGR